MAQSLSQIYLHLIFSTKNRFGFLRDPDIRDRAHAYLAGACKKLQCPALIIGGVEDHVHILCRFGKTRSLADFIRELKRESSKWVKEQSPELRTFSWQNGYGAFSISPGHVDMLMTYIRNQVEHHRVETFQDEFRRILKLNGVDFDERYVWD
mgnify:CR=1 FL=1